jgi:short-subunit dehydrogenase
MPEPKLAAITGASAGIGAMFARKLAARGYDLLLIARREDRLRSLASELAEAHHVKADFMVVDLADAADLERAAKRIQSAVNLALLVNNAGFGLHGLFFESDVAGQAEMHRLHVVATMRLMHAALVNLVPRGIGGAINVASVGGFAQAPGSVSYNSTKTWMISFTEGIAMELASKESPVRVQALCPGFTLSEFHDVIRMDRSAIPQSLWMTSDFVVEESLRGFERGKLIVIPGWRYKLIVAGVKMLPARLMRRLSRGGTRRFRRPKD